MTSTVRSKFSIRIEPEDRVLFEEAANLQGKTMTAFVLDAARRAAKDAMLDHVIAPVGAPANEVSLQSLYTPLAPKERLKKTLRTKAPWETN